MDMVSKTPIDPAVVKNYSIYLTLIEKRLVELNTQFDRETSYFEAQILKYQIWDYEAQHRIISGILNITLPKTPSLTKPPAPPNSKLNLTKG